MWRNVLSVFGNNKSYCGWGKSHCLFCCFVFLFHMCLFTSHRDSDQSMITLRMDCNYGLRISSRLCKRVWIQWELHDTSMIYVVFWFILYLTNSGLNLPVGVWTLLSSCIQLPNFMTLIQLHVLLAAFLTAHSGAIKTSPTRESYLSFNWACSNLFSTQNQDVQHSCNWWGRCLHGSL